MKIKSFNTFRGLNMEGPSKTISFLSVTTRPVLSGVWSQIAHDAANALRFQTLEAKKNGTTWMNVTVPYFHELDTFSFWKMFVELLQTVLFWAVATRNLKAPSLVTSPGLGELCLHHGADQPHHPVVLGVDAQVVSPFLQRGWEFLMCEIIEKYHFLTLNRLLFKSPRLFQRSVFGIWFPRLFQMVFGSNWAIQRCEQILHVFFEMGTPSTRAVK